MSLPIRFLPEANEEFEHAIEWYADRGKDLARDFVARVGAIVRRVAAQPTMHANVYKDVRKAVLTRFPYIVLYREDNEELVVISVFHTSRNPDEWQSRVN